LSSDKGCGFLTNPIVDVTNLDDETIIYQQSQERNKNANIDVSGSNLKGSAIISNVEKIALH
jgi:hypothetical protein